MTKSPVKRQPGMWRSPSPTGSPGTIPRGGVTRQAATRAGSDYTATFTDFDVRNGGTLSLQHYDASTDFGTRLEGWQPIRYQYFEVYLGREVKGVAPSADETVTASLYASDGTTLLDQTSDDRDDDPWGFQVSDWDPPIAPGHWVTVVGESGWEAGLQVPSLTIDADPDADLISGEGPKALVLVKHGYDGGWDERWLPVDGYVLDQGHFGRDVKVDESIDVTYAAPDGNRVTRPLVWPRMRVFYDWDTVRCDYPLGHTVWVTVTDTLGTVKATASDVTAATQGEYTQAGFNLTGEEWSPAKPDLRPGDRVVFEADDGYSSEIRIGSIAADLDVAADRVSGRLYAPWFTEVLTGWVKNFHWWGMGGVSFTTEPDGGSFRVPVEPNDIISGTGISVRYVGPNRGEVQRSFTAQDPSALGFKLGVNYTDDWVNGHCEPGHRIDLWVREGLGSGQVAASGHVTSAPCFEGGAGGFEGSWVEWDTDPEIEPGDWVFGEADNGETRVVRVGTITGRADAGDDTAGGTIDVPWVEEAVRVKCSGWGGAPDTAPRKQDYVLSDGVDAFQCAWDPDTEWDLQGGQVVGVWYEEPDGDEVFAALQIEAGGVFLPLVIRSG